MEINECIPESPGILEWQPQGRKKCGRPIRSCIWYKEMGETDLEDNLWNETGARIDKRKMPEGCFNLIFI